MYSLWSDDPKKIKSEISQHILNRNPFYFLQQQTKKMLPVNARSLSHNDTDLLVFDKHQDLESYPKTCIFCYKTPSSLMRCFQALLDSATEKRSYFKYPEKILSIQRRKSVRAPTSRESQATFFFMNKRRVNTGVIEDISMKGVRISTDIPVRIEAGEIIAPLTMQNFYERFYTGKNYRLQIPEARVSWSKFNGIRTTQIGVHFNLPEANLSTLNDYLEIRGQKEAV